MKKLITLAFALAVVATVFATAFVIFGSSDAEAKQADPNIVVVLRGPGTLLAQPLVVGALCYETDLFDAHTDRLIGTGVDCLANIQAIGDGFLIDRTTFLNMPQGTVVANGLTTVKPVLGGSPGFTHIVGDIPAEGDNSFVAGLSTGRFNGASGTVRLSGAVNLLGAMPFPAAVEMFNCIFIIDMD